MLPVPMKAMVLSESILMVPPQHHAAIVRIQSPGIEIWPKL
jgi:hypothetical protein